MWTKIRIGTAYGAIVVRNWFSSAHRWMKNAIREASDGSVIPGSPYSPTSSGGAPRSATFFLPGIGAQQTERCLRQLLHAMISAARASRRGRHAPQMCVSSTGAKTPAGRSAC